MIRVVESVDVAILTNNQLVRDRKVAIVFGIIRGRKKAKCGSQNVIFVFAILEMVSNMEQSCVRFLNVQISRKLMTRRINGDKLSLTILK